MADAIHPAAHRQHGAVALDARRSRLLLRLEQRARLHHAGDEGRQVHLCREGHRRAAEIRHPDLLRRTCAPSCSIRTGPCRRPSSSRTSGSALAPGQRRRHARHFHPDAATSCRSATRASRSTPRRSTGNTPISGKYTFTQEPGPDNVLGALKFNFPNRHAIYMHDTIQPELFNETVRTLSHGCIRVRQPDRLAALLLAEDKGWSPQQVKDLARQGQEQRRDAEPAGAGAPHLFHRRWSTAQGKLQTFADIYGLDKKMAYALFGKSDALVRSPPERCRGSAAPGTAAGLRLASPACSATESRAFRRLRRRGLVDGGEDRPRQLAERRVARSHHQHQIAGPAPASAMRATSHSRDGANSAFVPSAPISATISAAEKSRVAVPPA